MTEMELVVGGAILLVVVGMIIAYLYDDSRMNYKRVTILDVLMEIKEGSAVKIYDCSDGRLGFDINRALRQLEKQKLISSRMEPGIVPRLVYAITTDGRKLMTAHRAARRDSES